MGLLSRLFKESVQKDRSFVRSWVEKRRRELRYSNDLSIENLFVSMMYGLSYFSEKGMRQSIPSKLKALGLDESEHYSGDAALFELGCYMYFRLDLWLCKHKPHHREDVSTTFANGFTELFTRALNSKDIPALFDQRLSQYAKLVRTGADIKEYHYHLSQLILRTRDNQLPTSYDFENAPVMITGCFEHLGVDIALAAWEKGMIPASVKNIEYYCDLVEQQEITEST
jgi:hypothetical protein